MSGVDNRIVTMQFNNREFEAGAKTTMSTLQKLKAEMSFGSIVGGTVRGLGTISSALGKIGLKTPFTPMIEGANKGLGILGTAFDRMGMRNPFGGAAQSAADLQRATQAAAGPAGMGYLEGGVTAVSSKFIALATIATTALANITNKVVNSVTSWLKSFTVAPVMDGLNEYQTTLQSIQTVQANTDKPLKEIEKSLKDLNDYSDTTIYNFGEMAKNVGTFTAAGINLKDSAASIKGIANMAALSGSTSQQAAGAMYQLSQAIAAGKVNAQDWNSVVNAGMAGKKLQTALANTASVMGTLDKSAISTDKSTGALKINAESFKHSIMSNPGAESWLTSGVLVNTLAALDGRFSAAYQNRLLEEDGTKRFTQAEIKHNMALARTNYEKKLGHKLSEQQWKDLRKLADSSVNAAQDVKTLGQVFDIAKETIGSGWSASFKNVFGDLKQSKKLFTDMSNGLNDIITKNSVARNEVLSKWSNKKNGGRDTLIDGLKNAWEALTKIIGPLKKGMEDIFPPTTAKDLKELTLRFEAFTEKLIPGKDTMEKLRDISGGVFAVFSIGKTILGGVVDGLKTMFGAVGGGNGNFLGFLANVGNLVKEFDTFLKTSGVVTAFFTGLGNILSVPLAILRGFAEGIGNIFSGFDGPGADAVEEKIGAVSDRFSGLRGVADKVGGWMSAIGKSFGKLGKLIGSAITGAVNMISKMFTPETFSGILDVINTSLLGAIVLMVRKFFTDGASIDLTGGLFDGIKETLGAATGAFESMQMKLKADILMKLALAIGAMALALLVLSGIDPKMLAMALGAMSAGFGLLVGTMATLMKVMGTAGMVQIYVVTSGMTKLALAILILALALKVLASLNFGELLRGLIGLSILLKILNKAIGPMVNNTKGLGKVSGALILLGIALNIMAIALKIFATMSWEEMARGMAGLAGTLLVLSGALKIMPDMKAEAVGLIALGVAINLIAVALKIFATMSWEEIARGLAALTASLALITLAIHAMPKTMILQAAALLVVSAALVILSSAIKIMGSMGWDEIGRGLAVLAGSLVILAVGLKLIGATGILGATALLVTATAMTLFLPVLVAFGAMKWETIIKSLAMLAGVFVVLGLAGYLLGPVLPVIIGLAGALVLIGAGFLLMGTGALAAATAFGIVIGAGTAGIEILIGMIGAIIKAIPPALVAFGKGLVQLAIVIGTAAPTFALAIWRVIDALLTQLIKAIPKFGILMLTLLKNGLKVLVKGIPMMQVAGFKLLLGLINGIRKNLPALVTAAVDTIVRFQLALAKNVGKLIAAGVLFILKLMEGIAKAVRDNSEEFGYRGTDIGLAIIEGMAKAIVGGAKRIAEAVIDIAKGALKAGKKALGIGGPSKEFEKEVGEGIPKGIVKGVQNEAPAVEDEIGNLGRMAVDKMDAVMRGVSDAMVMDPNFNPTVMPVLDLSALTKEANKMGAILATAPIMAQVSYQEASGISAMMTPPEEPTSDSAASGSGTQNVELNLNLHSPRPIDSVEAYRAGKTLISLAKEAVK